MQVWQRTRGWLRFSLSPGSRYLQHFYWPISAAIIQKWSPLVLSSDAAQAKFRSTPSVTGSSVRGHASSGLTLDGCRPPAAGFYLPLRFVCKVFLRFKKWEVVLLASKKELSEILMRSAEVWAVRVTSSLLHRAQDRCDSKWLVFILSHPQYHCQNTPINFPLLPACFWNNNTCRHAGLCW